jgi:heptosyltransferase-2
MRSKGRILVIRGGAIGDFILTLPVLAALRAHFPETRLEVLGYPHIARLAMAGGLADEVQHIEARALAGYFASGGALDPALAVYFTSFNIILSYLYDPDAIFQNNVRSVSQAQFITGPHRPDEKLALHATEVFLKPLERLAIFAADPVPRLFTEIRPAASHRVALHPGSGSVAKNWPEAKWAELLRRLVNEIPASILLVGGEAEEGRLERLARLVPAERLETAWNLPLPELAASLRECSVFAGHDSGITHLAAACGVPSVVLWGPTTESVWRPLGRQVTLLRHPDGLENLPVEDVFFRINDATGSGR